MISGLRISVESADFLGRLEYFHKRGREYYGNGNDKNENKDLLFLTLVSSCRLCDCSWVPVVWLAGLQQAPAQLELLVWIPHDFLTALLLFWISALPGAVCHPSL